ncbi:Nn.00g071600.m01.CDS01 [Neocucurbitaria sp. VM-36]
MRPDIGHEDDFIVVKNPFAFSPMQFKRKMLEILRPSALLIEQLGQLGQLEETVLQAEELIYCDLQQECAESYLIDNLPPSSPSKTVYNIPGVLAQNHRIKALGDTAAKLNFMHEAEAIRRGFPIDRKNVRQVTITRDHSASTTGTTQVPFSFESEKDTHLLTFHLLPDCVHKVILGKAFLKATNTFSVLKNFARRVQRRVVKGLTDYALLYLGESAPKFTGLLNGRPRQALADSGANCLIMDEDFARKQGLPIVAGEEHRATVRFADNTTARTSGMTFGVRWEFGLGGVGTEHELDFHILKGAPADVILSDEFIFGTNAFVEYDCYLVDDDDDDEEADAYFFGIQIDKSYRTKDSVPEQLSEDIRRSKEDDRINNLPLEEQEAERQKEKHRRAEWDARYITTNGGNGSLSGGTSLSSLTGTQASNSALTSITLITDTTSPGTSVSSTVRPSTTLSTSTVPNSSNPIASVVPIPSPGSGHISLGSPQSPGSSTIPLNSPPGMLPQNSPPKKSRWRFKLKRKNRT